MKIKIQLMSVGAEMPDYATKGAAGADLRACCPGRVIDLRPGEWRLVPLGFGMELPEGYEAQIRPRSGIALKHGITVLNAPGTIDADYRGEVHVMLHNISNKAFRINHGDRIAQMVVAPAPQVKFFASEQLVQSERGTGGFGSTGVA